MSKIWYILLIVGLILCIVTNNYADVASAILESASDTFDVFLKLALMMLFWNGIFNIALKSQMIKKMTIFFKKPLAKLFPELTSESVALEYICGNITANLLGIGAAGTALGLKAMEELQKNNENKKVASRSMITFVLLNVCSFSIFPTTIISIRKAYKGMTSIKLVLIMILVSLFSLAVTLILNEIFASINRKKKIKCKLSSYTFL